MAVEDRLISLEYQLRLTEDRIRTDLRERDLAWLEHARKGMMLLSRMIVEAISSPRDRLREPLVKLSGELLIPNLEARAINVEEYRAYAPEKVELLGGYLFDGAETRHRLLNLLLVNVGLLEAVRLAPQDRWQEALARVYGPGGA
jgi:hypothetical protein